MRHHTLTALSLALLISPQVPAAPTLPAPTPADPAQVPAQVPAQDPMEQRLAEMEAIIASIRATDDPLERQRLLRRQAREVREAMRLLAMGYGRGPRAMPPGMPPQDMWSGPRRGMWGPEPSRYRHLQPLERGPGPGTTTRRGPEYEAMQHRMNLMQQRLDEQQKTLDEILQYREPFEELMRQQGVQAEQQTAQ